MIILWRIQRARSTGKKYAPTRTNPIPSAYYGRYHNLSCTTRAHKHYFSTRGGLVRPETSQLIRKDKHVVYESPEKTPHAGIA